MFEHSFVVSLTSTPERLAGFIDRSEKAGLDGIKPFPAITSPPSATYSHIAFDGRRGAMGCYMSHNAIIRMAHAMQFPEVYIFEDDAEFAPDFKERAALFKSRLPEDWDIFFIGISEILNRTWKAHGVVSGERGFGTHCYCINGRSYGKVISALDTYSQAIDILLTDRRHGLNVYFALPALSWQIDNVSTIDGKPKHYKHPS